MTEQKKELTPAEVKIVNKIRTKMNQWDGGFNFAVAKDRADWFEKLMTNNKLVCESYAESTAHIEEEKPSMWENIKEAATDWLDHIMRDYKEGEESEPKKNKRFMTGVGVGDLVAEDFKNADKIITVFFSVSDTDMGLRMRKSRQ